jgi:hypothetical protein
MDGCLSAGAGVVVGVGYFMLLGRYVLPKSRGTTPAPS